MNACANCKINKTCPNANESDGFEVCEDSEDRQIDGGIKMTNREKVAEILLQKMGEPISDNPPEHLEFIDVHNATRIKIVADEIVALFPTFTEEWLEKVLPEKRDEYIPSNRGGGGYDSGDAFNDGYNKARQDCKQALLSQGKEKG